MPRFQVSVPAVIEVTVDAGDEGNATQKARVMFAELPSTFLDGRAVLRVGEIIHGVSDLSIKRLPD